MLAQYWYNIENQYCVNREMWTFGNIGTILEINIGSILVKNRQSILTINMGSISAESCNISIMQCLLVQENKLTSPYKQINHTKLKRGELEQSVSNPLSKKNPTNFFQLKIKKQNTKKWAVPAVWIESLVNELSKYI